MRGERRLLRLGEFLVSRACQGLPREIREERCREWAAELPAILHDPQIRLAPRRAVRMLAYAADTLRGAATLPVRARRTSRRMAATLRLWILAGLANVAWNVWNVGQAPGLGLSYLLLAWSLLLLAFPVSVLVRSSVRVTTRIYIGGILTGLAFSLWSVAQAPRDWVHYISATLLVIAALAWWLTSRARARRA